MNLSGTERLLLRMGVLQWHRADAAHAPAVRLLGVDDLDDLGRWMMRTADALAAGRALDPDDLRRALLATELAFASDRLGWGRDWSADSGFTDRDTATLLRSIQERVAYPDLPVSIAEPAWVPMDEEADDVNWYRFEHDFAFRPSTHPQRWPSITEPAPSITYGLEPITRASGNGPLCARTGALDTVTLLAFTEILPPGGRVAVLDWQHTSRWWRPHRQVHRDDRPWPTTVFPNGDYHVFLTDDLANGTFGHPWEQTLCVFGQPLLEALAPLLGGWLPVVRSQP